MTVMLWLIWSDTLRSRRPVVILYVIRIALFLGVSAMLIANMLRYPHLHPGSSKIFTVAAALVGVLGAGYFVRRLVRRS